MRSVSLLNYYNGNALHTVPAPRGHCVAPRGHRVQLCGGKPARKMFWKMPMMHPDPRELAESLVVCPIGASPSRLLPCWIPCCLTGVQQMQMNLEYTYTRITSLCASTGATLCRHRVQGIPMTIFGCGIFPLVMYTLKA